MNTEVCPFSGFSPRHAALLILAGMSLLRLRALPDTVITALADVFHCRF